LQFYQSDDESQVDEVVSEYSEEESDESGESWDELEEKARKGKYFDIILCIRKCIVNKGILFHSR